MLTNADVFSYIGNSARLSRTPQIHKRLRFCPALPITGQQMPTFSLARTLYAPGKPDTRPAAWDFPCGWGKQVHISQNVKVLQGFCAYAHRKMGLFSCFAHASANAANRERTTKNHRHAALRTGGFRLYRVDGSACGAGQVWRLARSGALPLIERAGLAPGLLRM